MVLHSKRFLIACIVSLTMLTACDSSRLAKPQATTVWQDPLWQAHYTSLQPLKAFNLKGRIGITNSQDSFSSNFLWQQASLQQLNFRMYGAFGQTYAIMQVTPEQSQLDTGDDRHYSGSDPEQLLHRVLGWSLPFQYLPDWIKGLPTGVEQDQLLINADGTLQRLNYYGYQVEYLAYKEFQGYQLPTKVKIYQADNKLTLSIRSWQFEPLN